jgi:hypothetical protein
MDGLDVAVRSPAHEWNKAPHDGDGVASLRTAEIREAERADPIVK